MYEVMSIFKNDTKHREFLLHVSRWIRNEIVAYRTQACKLRQSKQLICLHMFLLDKGFGVIFVM